MASIGKKMAKNSVVYILGKALSIIVSIILLPIYTSKIPTSSYGYYDLINTLVTYGVAVLVLNISIAVLRFGYEESGDKKKLFSTSLMFTVVMSLFATGVLFIVNIFYPIRYLPIIIALIFVTGLTNLGGSFARCQDKSKIYAYSGLIAGLVNAGVGIFCVYVFKMQELALFLSLLISHSIQAIFLLLLTKSFKYISFKSFSLKGLKRMLVFSSPHAISLLCAFLCRDIDKTIISIYLGDGALGVFSMSLKYMSFITAVVDALALAWSDTTFSISDQNDRVSSSLTWVNNITGIAAFVSVLFIPLIFVSYPYLIKGDYVDAFNVIPIIYISVFFLICNGFYANSFLSEKKPIFLMISRLIAATVNLIIVFSLIRKIGIYAVAIGYAVSSAIEFFFSHLFARIKLQMSFSFKPILYFLPTYGLATLVYYLGNSFTNLAIVFLLIFVAYMAFHRKINQRIRSIVARFSSKNIYVLDCVEKDFAYCKAHATFVIELTLILLLNIAASFGIYLISFLLSRSVIVVLIIVGLVVITIVNCLVGRKAFKQLYLQHKNAYFVVLIILSWIICSIPLSFLNNSLFKITGNTFGVMPFVLSILIYGIYFTIPFIYLGARKNE